MPLNRSRFGSGRTSQHATRHSMRCALDIDGLCADVVKAEDEVAELRAELVDLRIEARHARDREAAAKARLDAALDAPPPAVVDQVAAAAPDRTGVAPEAVAEVARATRELAGRLEALLPSETPATPPRVASTASHCGSPVA